MHQQLLKNPPLKPLQGFLVVLGTVAALFLDSLLVQLLIPLIGGMPGFVLFWALGILIALFVMNRYVMAFSYAVNRTTLQITFVYGRYRRLMEEIYLNNILRIGTLEELRSRYPGARVHRATRRVSEPQPLAVAYRSNGKPAILLLQPDPTVAAALDRGAN